MDPLKLHAGLRNIGHSGRGVSELNTSVHAESTGSLTKSVSLRSVLPAVADLAVQPSLVFRNAYTVQKLVAHIAFETLLMPFSSGGYSLLCGINGFAASRALRAFWHSERHGYE